MDFNSIHYQQNELISAGAVVGNFIYVIGGSDGTVYTNTTYKYDIAGNTWSTVAPLPDYNWLGQSCCL